MDTVRFLVFLLVSFVVFNFLLRWVVRERMVQPRLETVLCVAALVVGVGMVFARYAANLGVSPAVYYGLPALVTLALPPLVFRMSIWETRLYLVLAFASSPAIHLFFSLMLGWHEYLPFWYVPSLREIMPNKA